MCTAHARQRAPRRRTSRASGRRAWACAPRWTWATSCRRRPATRSSTWTCARPRCCARCCCGPRRATGAPSSAAVLLACLPHLAGMTQLACASTTGRVCCQSCSASQLEPAKRSLGGSERAGEGCPNARGRHAAAQPHVDAGGPRSSPFGPAATKRRAGARAPRAAAGRQAAPRLAGRPGGHGVVRRGGCHERQQHR